MSENRIAAALIDVFGTLWPERAPLWIGEEEYRARLSERLCQALPRFSRNLCADLCVRLLDRAREKGYDVRLDTRAVIQDLTQEMGLTVDDQRVSEIKKAMSLPYGGVIKPFQGAQELLGLVKDLGLRCIIVSNTSFKTGQDYQRDFDAFGHGRYVDGIVSSVDVGFRKPHLAMFQAALAMAGCTAERCVYIGNSERDDVEPAVSLGMRVIRVAIEEPLPPESAAHTIAASLAEAAEILKTWVKHQKVRDLRYGRDGPG